MSFRVDSMSSIAPTALLASSGAPSGATASFTASVAAAVAIDPKRAAPVKGDTPDTVEGALVDTGGAWGGAATASEVETRGAFLLFPSPFLIAEDGFHALLLYALEYVLIVLDSGRGDALLSVWVSSEVAVDPNTCRAPRAALLRWILCDDRSLDRTESSQG